jgi:hypothetical protein
MAIVKVKYTRSRPGIKKHLRYIVHRPGKEQETMTRRLYRDQYQFVDKQYAYALINAAPRGTTFYKLIINFDAVKEDRDKDLDLQFITSKTIREMRRLINRDVPFIATIHDDHTPLRHIHAIALVQGRLSRAEFAKLLTLKYVATAEARRQRQLRDHVQERRQERSRGRYLANARLLSQPVTIRPRRRRYRPLRIQSGCDSCGYGQIMGIPSYRQYCPSCHKPLHQEKTVQLELDRQR